MAWTEICYETSIWSSSENSLNDASDEHTGTHCVWRWPTAEAGHPRVHSEPAALMMRAAAARVGWAPAVLHATAGPQSVTMTMMTLAEMCAAERYWSPAQITTAQNPALTQCRCAGAVNSDTRNVLVVTGTSRLFGSVFHQYQSWTKL